MAFSDSQLTVLGACGLAALIVALTAPLKWNRSGCWLAIALVGQACALQLISSPKYAVYQFFRPPAEIIDSWRVFCLGVVVIHGLLVGVVGRGIARRAWQIMKEILRPIDRALLLGFLGFASVLVSTDGLQYRFGVFLVVWVAVSGALSLALVVQALPSESLRRVEERIGTGARGSMGPLDIGLDRWLPRIAAAWVLCVSTIIAWFVLDGVPHIQDSISYLFQAKYFSAGHLYLPAPPDRTTFLLDHMLNDGEKWYGYGFPGWPAVLGLGVLVGAPWLVNPILGAIAILLTHSLIKRLYDTRLAHAAVLLLAFSPWFLAMSANFMNHTLCLVLILAALLATERAVHGKSLIWGAVTGLLLGYLCLSRPLESIFISAVVGLRVLGLSGPRPPFKLVVPIIAGAILVGGLILPYNNMLTGDPFYPPHMKWTDTAWGPGVDRLGFGPEIGRLLFPHHNPLPGHGLADVLLNANKNTHVVNFELFGWTFGSLLFVAAAFFFRAFSRADLLFWGMIVIVVGGYSFYWHPGGPDFGSRYWYPLIIPGVVLTVRGAQVLADRLREFDSTNLITARLCVFIVAATLLGFVNVMPWRAVEKYHRYMGMSDDVATLARSNGFETGALVFVHAGGEHYDSEIEFGAAFVFNPPTLSHPGTIYVRYENPEQQSRIAALYPGRPVWHIDQNEHGRFDVIKAPTR